MRHAAGTIQLHFLSVSRFNAVVQLLFYATVACVTVLTYRRARKSVLQPFRAEIFKAQLAALALILDEFNGKTELDLMDAMDWRRMERANRDALVAAFAEDVYMRPLKGAHMIHDEVDFVGGISVFKPDEQVSVLTGPVRPKADSVYSPPWEQRPHATARITRTYSEYRKHIDVLAGSPLVPSELQALLDRYRSEVDGMISQLALFQGECALKLREMYPTYARLERFQHVWMTEDLRVSPYNYGDNQLGTLADEMVTFIRSYYSPDTLLRF